MPSVAPSGSLNDRIRRECASGCSDRLRKELIEQVPALSLKERHEIILAVNDLIGANQKAQSDDHQVWVDQARGNPSLGDYTDNEAATSARYYQRIVGELRALKQDVVNINASAEIPRESLAENIGNRVVLVVESIWDTYHGDDTDYGKPSYREVRGRLHEVREEGVLLAEADDQGFSLVTMVDGIEHRQKFPELSFFPFVDSGKTELSSHTCRLAGIELDDAEIPAGASLSGQ